MIFDDLSISIKQHSNGNRLILELDADAAQWICNHLPMSDGYTSYLQHKINEARATENQP
jgi:hypothetical protein